MIIGKVGLPGEAGPGSLCNVLLTASCLTHGITNTGVRAEYVCVISQQRCQWWGMAGKGSEAPQLLPSQGQDMDNFK